MPRSKRPLQPVLRAACGAACALATAAAQPAETPIRLALPRPAPGYGHEPRLVPSEAPGPMLAPRESALVGARLIEVPRDASPGTYGRPRYALGFRSEALRKLMNEIGIEANSCLAPVVRLRTKISGEGDVSGAIWIYARCTIR